MTVLPKAKKSSVNAVARQSEGRAFDSTPSCAAGFHTQYERREARHLFNHIMLRVKDPKRSLDFYQQALGMRLIKQSDYQDGRFSLYFLAFEDSPNAPMIELTHNWGTENDAEFSYHNGNSEPRGFGHICLEVDDLAEAVAWFDRQQVTFVKRPEEGVMKDIAFVADPDGYWVEIIAKQ